MSNNNIYKIPLDKFNGIVEKLKLKKDTICNNTTELKGAFLEAFNDNTVISPPVPPRPQKPAQNDVEQKDMEQKDMEQKDMEQQDMEQKDMEQTDVEQKDMEQKDMEQKDMEQKDMEQKEMEQKSIVDDSIINISLCDKDIEQINSLIETLAEDKKPIVSEVLNEIIKLCDEHDKLTVNYTNKKSEEFNLYEQSRTAPNEETKKLFNAQSKTVYKELEDILAKQKVILENKKKLLKKIETTVGPTSFWQRLTTKKPGLLTGDLPGNICEKDIQTIEQIMSSLSDEKKEAVKNIMIEIISICEDYKIKVVEYNDGVKKYNEIADKSIESSKTFRTELEEKKKYLDYITTNKNKLLQDIDNLVPKQSVIQSNLCENDIKAINSIIETIPDDMKSSVNLKLDEIIKICKEYDLLGEQYIKLENEYNALDDANRKGVSGKAIKSRLDEMVRQLNNKIQLKDKLVKEIQNMTGKKSLMDKFKGRLGSLFSKKPTETTITTIPIEPSAPLSDENKVVKDESTGFLSSLFGSKKTTTQTSTDRLGAPVICHDINSDDSKKYMVDTNCEEKINNLRKEMDKMTQKINELEKQKIDLENEYKQKLSSCASTEECNKIKGELDILRKKYDTDVTTLTVNNSKADENKKQLETELTRLNNELNKSKAEYLEFKKRKEEELNKITNLSKGEKDEYTRKTLQEKTDLSNKLVETKNELDKLKAQYQQNINQLGSTNKYEKGQMNERITKLYNDYQVRLNTLRNNQQIELDNLRKKLVDLDREKQVLGTNVNKLENERQNILSGFKNVQDKYNQLQKEGAYTNQQKDANIQNMLRQYEDKYRQLQQQNIRMTQEIDRKNNLIIETERMREAYNNLQNKYRELMDAPVDYEEEEARQRELERVKSEYDMLRQQYNTTQNELRTTHVLPTITQPIQQPTVKKSIFNRLFGTEPEPELQPQTITQAPLLQSQTINQSPLLQPQTITQSPLLQPQTITQAPLLQAQPQTITQAPLLQTQQEGLLEVEPEPEEETSFFKRIMDVVSPEKEEEEPGIREIDTSPILKIPTPVELAPTVMGEITDKEEPKVIYRSKPCKRKSSKKKKSSKRKTTSQRKQSLQPIIYIQTSYDGKDNVSVSKGNITFPRKPRSQKKTSQKLSKKSSKKKSCSKIKSLTK
jgi:hypothetical protein